MWRRSGSCRRHSVRLRVGAGPPGLAGLSYRNLAHRVLSCPLVTAPGARAGASGTRPRRSRRGRTARPGPRLPTRPGPGGADRRNRYSAPITRAAQNRSHTIPIQWPAPPPPPNHDIMQIHLPRPEGLSVATHRLQKGGRRRRPRTGFRGAPTEQPQAGRLPKAAVGERRRRTCTPQGQRALTPPVGPPCTPASDAPTASLPGTSPLPAW
jgi:hypothetical protein